MTDVILNRLGVDHVSLNMTTTGDNVASATLNELLLDPTLEYVMRISELNAPVNSLPLFGYNSAGTQMNEELFRIKHRVAQTTRVAFEAGFDTTGFAGALGFGSSFRTLGAGGRVHFTSASFLTELARSANTTTVKLDAIGFGQLPGANHEYLRIRINADGCTEFIGSSDFWNNFCIVFTDLGRILFGVDAYVKDNIMSVNTLVNLEVQYNMFDIAGIIDLTQGGYRLAFDTNTLVGAYPIFKHLDHRYFVSVETDLMVNQSIKVVDGIQTLDRSLSKTFFPTETKVLLQSEGGVLREDVDMQMKARVGQYAFIKKTEPNAQWISLTTSYNIRFFRFHLYFTFRRLVGNKFIFTQMKYPISPDDSWDLNAEFVSKI
jgi:hypothetical protein